MPKIDVCVGGEHCEELHSARAGQLLMRDSIPTVQFRVKLESNKKLLTKQGPNWRMVSPSRKLALTLPQSCCVCQWRPREGGAVLDINMEARTRYDGSPPGLQPRPQPRAARHVTRAEISWRRGPDLVAHPALLKYRKYSQNVALDTGAGAHVSEIMVTVWCNSLWLWRGQASRASTLQQWQTWLIINWQILASVTWHHLTSPLRWQVVQEVLWVPACPCEHNNSKHFLLCHQTKHN